MALRGSNSLPANSISGQVLCPNIPIALIWAKGMGTTYTRVVQRRQYRAHGWHSLCRGAPMLANPLQLGPDHHQRPVRRSSSVVHLNGRVQHTYRFCHPWSTFVHLFEAEDPETHENRTFCYLSSRIFVSFPPSSPSPSSLESLPDSYSVTITSIIRLLLLIQGLFALSIFPRAMMDGNIGFVTSVIETNLALITASAPALRPIFRSRANGGWFATARSMAVSRKTVSDESDEVEKGLRKIRSRKSIDANGPPPVVGSGVGGKFGRGGRRGGRSMRNNPLFSRRNKMEWKPSGFRGDNKIRGVRNRHIIRVRTDLATPLQGPAPPSPRTSEEPLTRTRSNTNGGVTIRVSDIQREIDGIVNDIASAGAGSYTGLFSSSASSSSLSSSLSPVISRPILTPGTTIRSTPTSPRVGLAPLLPFPPPPVPPPSGGLPARPSTSGSMKGSRTVVLEQHYSASIYPDDQDNENTRPRKSEEIRKSRYGDERRYGVVTPRGTTPIQRGWEVDGRPF